MLAATNIRKTLGDSLVLKDVDITVTPAQIAVLLGPSGSGKTTLLRALSCLEPPDSGTIAIDDQVFRFPWDATNPFIGPWPRVTVVFQQLFLWPHLTLRQNIQLVMKSVRRLRSDAHLCELIDLFDMGEFIDRYPNQASLGQRQRAALARALVLKPAYILLDEVTSALDVEQVAVILSHLLELRRQGIGIMLITHLLGFARRAADRVFFLDDGTIASNGGPEILHSPSHPRLKKFVSVIEAAT